MAKTKLRKTITNVGYAPALIDQETGGITYGDVVWFVHNEAGGREYSASPNGETTSIYADGMEVYSAEENHGYDIDLTLLRVTDDVDTAWLGRVVEDGAVFEYASNEELPHFALIIIEDTTDGIGETNVWYDCHCSERPEMAGKTMEGAGFDPEFPTYKIAARPRMSDRIVSARIPGKSKLTTIPEPKGTTLTTLKVGTLALDPPFNGGVTSYTATTSNTTDTVTAEAASDGAQVVIKNGATTVTNGGAATWTTGTNTLTVTVTNGEKSQTYSVKVTKS